MIVENDNFFRAASNKTISCAQIKGKLKLKISRQTVWRSLRDNGTIKFMKMRKKPPLKPIHKTQRVTWAREKVRWSEKWKNVIFSDEKNVIWMVQMISHAIGMICERINNFFQNDIRGVRLS